MFCDHPIAAGRDREDYKRPLLRPKDRHFGVGKRISAHVNVGEHPVAVHRHARERNSKRVPDDAVRAVAADKPVRGDRFHAAVRAA
jgi:hypothetical protein